MQELQQPAQHASWVRLQVAGWLYVAVPASTTTWHSRPVYSFLSHLFVFLLGLLPDCSWSHFFLVYSISF